MLTTSTIPVTVLTGFLGSGKTTLVNHILTAEHGLRIAVIENEFGDIGIDDALVIGGDEKIIEMSNGCCLCCSARTDLIEILNSLQDRKDEFDLVLIETSGMADPSPVAQTFFVDETVAQHFRLDAIVTLADAKHIEQHLDETQVDGVGNHASNQIAFADRVIINKVDLVAPEHLAAVTDRVRANNEAAEILTSSYGAVDLSEILGIDAFNRDRAGGDATDWLHSDDHSHDPSLESVSVELDGRFSLESLQQWFTEYTQAHGSDLYRLKGMLRIAGEPLCHLVQGVHRLFTISPGQTAESALERSVVVVIGRNLDRETLTEGLRTCLAEPALVP